MNQELIDRIQQDAVTIQRLTADLDSIKQEQASNASDYKEKLQAEETRYARLLSETTDKLYVSQRFAELQKQRLQEAQQRIEEKDSEIGKLITLSNDRAREIGRLFARDIAIGIEQVKAKHAQQIAALDN